MKGRRIMSRWRWRWLLPLPIAFVAALVAGIFAIRAPNYAATISVAAIEPGNSTSQALSFVDVVQSSTVATRALSDTGINESTSDLASNLTVATTRSSLYKITVAYQTPAGATDLANAVASEASVMYQNLANGGSTPVSSQLTYDEAYYRNLYVNANQALLNFEAAHPELLKNQGSPAVKAEHDQLLLEQHAAESEYIGMQTAAATARVSQLSNLHQFAATVVDPATVNSQSLIKALRVLASGVLGLVAGIGILISLPHVRAALRRRRQQVVVATVNGHVDLPLPPPVVAAADGNSSHRAEAATPAGR